MNISPDIGAIYMRASDTYMRLCIASYYPGRLPVGEDRYGRPLRGLPAWQVCASTHVELVSAPVPHGEPVSITNYGD